MSAYDSINNLLVSLQIPHTADQVREIDAKLSGKYEMICQENIGTGDGANDRYTATVENFFARERSLLKSARWVGADLIVNLFANSLDGGKGCPAGSPPEVRSSLRRDFNSLSLVLEFQSRMGAARQSNVALAQLYHLSSEQSRIIAEKIDKGFFVSRNEIEALKIIRNLAYSTYISFVGMRLMNMITWGDLGEPRYPVGFGDLTLGVKEYIRDVGDWRHFLTFVFGKMVGEREIEEGGWQWETSVLGKIAEVVNETEGIAIQRIAITKSLVVLLEAGFGGLTMAFLQLIDAWHWSADPAIDVLLHVAASRRMDRVRAALVGISLSMFDEDFFFRNGGFPVPSRITTLLVYPQISGEAEDRLFKLLSRVFEGLREGDFLGEPEGIDLALAFVESLRTLYAKLLADHEAGEWRRLVSDSIVFRLLDNALGRDLNRASIGLLNMALEKASGLYWDEMGDAEQYITPLFDPFEREFLDATTLEWEDYLDDYNRRHRKGGGGTGGAGGTVLGLVNPEDTGETSGGMFSASYSAQLYYQNPRVNFRQRTQTLRQRYRSPAIVSSMRIFYGVPTNARNVFLH